MVYNFTVKGSLACLIDIAGSFISRVDTLDTTAMVELLNAILVVSYYTPIFEDIINIVGFSFDTIKLINPYFLLSTVAIIQDYK